MANNEIKITLTTVAGQTETISLMDSLTSLSNLIEFATALFGITSESNIALLKDGKVLFATTSSTTSDITLKNAGLQNGDLILVSITSNDKGVSQRTASTSSQALPPSSNSASSEMSLDFSSILNSAASQPTSTPKPTPTPPSNGLTFNIPGMYVKPQTKTPIEWEGMSLDDAISRNPNPDTLVKILFNHKKHPHMLKELNHHSPLLAAKLKEAGITGAARVWREEIMKGGINRAIHSSQAKSKDEEMTKRLRENAMDDEANKYFGEKIKKKNVEEQYLQMMETYPESMGRVLMLYIETKVNSVPMQAFVDSGAQSTIMSATAAEKCGLLHLLDTRFEGTAVGVGTGKILGRIHIAPITVNGHFFPCTITVMDDGGKGLGDKNMEFLFGLDMLKRHRCKIDLERNALAFKIEGGKEMITPFLHEKDLDASKGGTKGFDADQANLELQKIVEKSLKEDK